MRSITIVIAALVMLSAAFAGAQKKDTSSDLFQKALDLERGKGDLEAAMQVYQQIIREFPADKPIAARALFRLGYCQELIGQAQARKSYEQLVRDYGTQRVVADGARARLAALAAAESALRNPTISIAEMDPRTGTIRGPAQLLTEGTPGRDQYPTWSPDGKSIAFKRTVNRGGQPTTSTVVFTLATPAPGASTDGGVRDPRARIVTEDELIGPSFWLPYGGGALASKKATAVYRYSPDGTSGALVNLGLRANDVTLAPDGRTLYALVLQNTDAFLSSTVLAIDVATGQRKRAFSLTASRPRADDFRELGNYISVSPNGSTLAIVGWTGERQPIIVLWGVDGSNKIETPAGSGLAQRVQWARDGQSVLFAMSQDGTRWQIMRLAVGSVSPVFTGLEVANLTYFDLNPDGSRIAFDGTAHIFAKQVPSAPR